MAQQSRKINKTQIKKSRESYVTCRLIDFKISDGGYGDSDNDQFKMQIFGIDENRKTYSIEVNNFKPFFYIRFLVIGKRTTPHYIHESHQRKNWILQRTP